MTTMKKDLFLATYNAYERGGIQSKLSVVAAALDCDAFNVYNRIPVLHEVPDIEVR